MSKRFYPSKKKINDNNQSLGNIFKINELLSDKETQELDLNKPYRFNDINCDTIHENWRTRFYDEWINTNASINSNNSLSLCHSTKVYQRLRKK